ncbi:MAG: SdpI family protein [Candidatus Diapherotrites archaeon]
MKIEQWMQLLILFAVMLGVFAYQNFPERIATHWNAEGNVDGYQEKGAGIILFPILVMLMYGLYVIIPKIDPLKKNIKEFQRYFGEFMIAMQLFLIYVFGLIIAYNMKSIFNFTTWMAPGFVFLLAALGKMLTHAKRNYLIGIRTPWTLADEDVWNETHQKTGKIYQGAALLPLIGMFTGNTIAFLLAAIIAPAIYGVVLSYILYNRKERKND